MVGIPRLLALAWAGGVALMLSRCLLGHLRLARLAWGSGGVADPRLARLLADEQARLGVRRRVRLAALQGDRIPSVAGWLRPLIFLPAGADGWPTTRLRAVLAHELAHVARHDGVTQFVAEGVLALHWFNPLAWLAARRMRIAGSADSGRGPILKGCTPWQPGRDGAGAFCA